MISTLRDEILRVVADAWASTGHYIAYPDRPEQRPEGNVPWARVTVRHAAGTQATLAGDSGRRRWERSGTVYVQIFTPAGEGLLRSDELAKVVLDAYEGATTPSGAWFRNARLNEIGPDGDWYAVNVLVDFVYQELK